MLVNANLAGHDSHGALRVPQYLDRIAAGQITPSAEPAVIRETATTMVIDGQHGFGHYATRWAMARAIRKAREAQVCCASLLRTGHIGRLGEYAEQAAHFGYVGLVTCGDVTPGGNRMAPFGGVQAVLGTNPLAVGVPTGDETPFILDYATSVVAEGKVLLARLAGVELPEGTLIDSQGAPSVRPEDLYEGGALLPFGRHKGYALGILACLLGGLAGAFDIERGTMAGTFIQVIDIGAFVPPDEFQRAVRAVLNGLKQVRPAPGADEVLVPGEPEHRARVRRLADGIDVPEFVWRQMEEKAERFGISLDEGGITGVDLTPYQTRS